MELRYNVCTQPRCKNPVPPTLDSRRCAAHGGETLPIWAIYHDMNGWLTDTGVGGSYSFDVDNAAWFGDSIDAVETLIACDLVDAVRAQTTAERWRRIGPFIIQLIK